MNRRAGPWGDHSHERREFLARLGRASQFAALGWAGIPGLPALFDARALARFAWAGERENPRRMSWLAYQTAKREGNWQLTDIEGEIPRDLNGTLHRIGPGTKEHYGVVLQHFFDGDAMICGFDFAGGRLGLRAQFIETDGRREERAAGRMLYDEFGTLAPLPYEERRGLKNQPSVNVIAWDGRLLGLSEGGHPTAIDPLTFAGQGLWDFHGTLPADVTFTAHPKFDPASGDGYGYGIVQGLTSELRVYRMNRGDGTLAPLYAIPLDGYPMIHDFIQTREHLVFVIPPVGMDIDELLSGTVPLAQVIRYFENQPTRLLILDKAGQAAPIWGELPPFLVFHHANGFVEGPELGGEGPELGGASRELDPVLCFDSMTTPGGSGLDAMSHWQIDPLPPIPRGQVTRFRVNLRTGALVSREVWAEGADFPAYDARFAGGPIRALTLVESTDLADPLVANRIQRHDLLTGRATVIDAPTRTVWGEPIFVPRSSAEGQGWLLFMGYSAERDETCLEIRDAETLGFAARAWTGTRIPLGFHGSFVPKSNG